MQNLKQQVMDNINSTGLSVIGVGADHQRDVPPFSYSIGLSLRNHHELFVEGLPHEVSLFLINEIAKISFEKDISLDHSCIIDGLLKNDLPIALIKSDKDEVKEERTIQVLHMLDVGDYGVLQIVIPDEKGSLPWEENFNEEIGVQNIFRKDASKAALQKLMNDAPRYYFRDVKLH